MAKVVVATVEVFGMTERAQLRLTALGAEPLVNGDRVRVPVDLARALCEEHKLHLRCVGAEAHSTPTETVEWSEGMKCEKLKAAAPAPTTPTPTPTDTGAAGEKSVEGEAANKNMAGKPTAKTK